MKILRVLFGRRQATVASVPPTPSAPEPIPQYYSELLKKIRLTESGELLRQRAAHPSGYVREAVLKRIVALALPELLPVVVDRLNDWVPQVQRAARTALMTLLPFLPVAQLLAVTPMILRLHSAGRADYAEWLKKFELILLQKVAVSDLCLAVRESTLLVARSEATISCLRTGG